MAYDSRQMLHCRVLHSQVLLAYLPPRRAAPDCMLGIFRFARVAERAGRRVGLPGGMQVILEGTCPGDDALVDAPLVAWYLLGPFLAPFEGGENSPAVDIVRPH